VVFSQEPERLRTSLRAIRITCQATRDREVSNIKNNDYAVFIVTCQPTFSVLKLFIVSRRGIIPKCHGLQVIRCKAAVFSSGNQTKKLGFSWRLSLHHGLEGAERCKILYRLGTVQLEVSVNAERPVLMHLNHGSMLT